MSNPLSDGDVALSKWIEAYILLFTISEALSAVTRRTSPRYGGFGIKRASFITLAIIGAYSATGSFGRLIIHYRGSRLIGQNQTYTVREGDKTCGLCPAF